MNSLGDGPQAGAITVVLVEDDAPTLWRLQDALIKAGYRVRAAGTLTEARACAPTSRNCRTAVAK